MVMMEPKNGTDCIAALPLHQSPVPSASSNLKPQPKLRIALALACVAAALTGLPALAAENADATGNDPAGEKAADSPADYWTPTLLGDMGGLRPTLARHGMTLNVTETSEYLGNVQGGIQTGQAYHGLTNVTLGLDTEQAGGWRGGSFNISALHIHGSQLSPAYLGSLQAASGIEALNGPRLWEAWYQQKLNDTVDIKVGQQSLDQEFMVSQYANTFAGTMFGWAAVPSYDLPAGGPAYPLSSIGARVRTRLDDSFTLLAGAFAGDPANTTTQDPQKANNRGTTFSLHGGTLYIAELQYGVNQAKQDAPDDKAKSGLPGMYKMGAWYHTRKFADTHFDSGGLSLSNPANSGSALQHAGNYSVYAVADQTVWRQSGEGARALNLFGRVMAAPGDRNLVRFSANLGATMNAPFAGRDSDVIGLGFGYVKVGSGIQGLDRDANTFNAANQPVRDDETFIEGTYQFQATPWLIVQSIVQYTLNPGGGAVDPKDASKSRKISNAIVVGLRSAISF
jgi:porin